MNHIEENEGYAFKHWATVVSEEAIERFGNKQVVATGWAPSGYYHVGNFKEAVTCRAIQRELINLGADSQYILNIDDVDTFVKIPAFFKKDYGKMLHPYIGHAINKVPDPLGCHDSYADHFIDNALPIMNDFDVNPEPIYTSKLYLEGKYDRYAKLFLEKKEEMSDLTEKITGSRMEDFFLIQCPECKNLAAPKIIDYEFIGTKIKVDILCQREKRGCGQKSSLILGDTLWKIKWRLDWAARQDFLGVTVESSGKDHGVAGGSIDSSLAIHRDIFDKEKLPLLIQHGFLTFGGKKLSGSTGSGMPVSEFPKILEPQTFLYKIYRNNLRTDVDFKVDYDVPSVASEYDRAEELFYDEVEIEHLKTKEKTVKAYELAQIDEKPAKKPVRVDYGHLVTVMQVCMFDKEQVVQKLTKRNILPKDISNYDMDLFNKRYEKSKYWIENYANENIKFKIVDEPRCEDVKTIEKKVLEHVLSAIKEIPEEDQGDDITQDLYSSAKAVDLKPTLFFRTIYKIILGRNSGPRAGTLIDALGKDEVVRILAKALDCY
ncbi:MAG: lysine--tRNA ligase [Candidatus Heimdallarchaeaceae archaeon]